MILGIECTAHTFGVGIVKEGKILCNIKDSYTTEKGGIIPMDAAKHHADVSEIIYQKALKEAGISEKEINAIAISNAPGLPPCLVEGMKFAKRKAFELGVSLIPVNHCVAHLEIGRITGASDPILLYASGANTQIIAYVTGKYRIFGETLDIGIGNFIDSFARIAGIGFPGGPKIQKIADSKRSEIFGNSKNKNLLSKRKYVELPYSIKGMDVTFSGMLTKLRQMYENNKYELKDLAFSLQETAFSMLVEAAERALAHTGKKELVLGGGVACNTRLQEMCRIMCEERGAKFFVPASEFLVDNGAMIAYLGELLFNSGQYFKPEDFDKLDIQPRQRTDEVEVRWR